MTSARKLTSRFGCLALTLLLCAQIVRGAQDGAPPVATPQTPVAAPINTPPTPEVKQETTLKPTARGAENAPIEDEITPELEEAVRRGLEYLKSVQNQDGSLGRGRLAHHAGISALAAIAFMAQGSVPGRGTYGEVVQRALEFVLSNCSETGLIASDDSSGPMYGHGFATLFLGEIHGMNRSDERVRDALSRAVQLIVNCQNDQGWRYNPVPYDADISVTICEVMALRSARNAGLKVPKETIDAAVRYVRACQNSDGGFRYMKEAGGSLWPRTAAGVAALFYAGVYEDDSAERGLDYLMKFAFPHPGAVNGAFAQSHYYYGHYYAAQAMYLAGGDRWSKWWPAVRAELLSRQQADGSWADAQSGEAYATAMALIVLQMPKRYLPIFQK